MGVEENIVAGKILYLNVCLPHQFEPHNKYFVVVGTGKFPLLLKINTSNELSKIAQQKHESHFKLKKSVYTFLEYDSFLDCGSLWSTLITTEEVISQITKDPCRIKLDITQDHKNEVIRKTEKSKSIERRHKRIIAEALRNKKV